jgi:hypothetical protein
MRLLAVEIIIVAAGCAAVQSQQSVQSTQRLACVTERRSAVGDEELRRRGVGALVVHVGSSATGYPSGRGLEVTLQGDTVYRHGISILAPEGVGAGRATLEFPSVRPGEYRMRVRQIGYHADSLPITVVVGRHDTVAFDLRAAPINGGSAVPCAHHAVERR